MPSYEDDLALRLAAFDHVRRLTDVRGDLSSADLRAGFQFRGERVPLINPQRGIFKPQRMHQIFEGVEAVEYAFMGQDSIARPS